MQRITTLLKTLICISLLSASANAQSWNYVGNSSGISSSAGTYNNIASDGTNPVIAYSTGSLINGSNEVKKYNGSTWSNYGSSSGFGSGHTYELKLAMDGTTPYAAWQDDGYSYKIVAAKFNGTNWQTLGNPGFSQGQVFSIDMTISGGTPYVLYKDGSFGQITVQKFDGNSWANVGSARFTPAIGSSIISPKICVNGTTPYVFFGDNATYGGKARLVKYDGANWINVGTPGFSNGTIVSTKLYFVGSTPYVAFTEQAANTYIKTMKYDGTNWVVINNAQFTTNSSNSLWSIEMNDTIPYVVFSDVDNGSKLAVKKFNGSNWVAVGTQGFTDASVSQAALTFVGKTPYVSFNNQAANNKVVVMKFDCSTTYGARSIAVCSSNLPYNFNGKFINAAGTYYDTLKAGNSVGCDSITTLNLTIDNTVCFNWAKKFGGKYQDQGNAITTDASGNVFTAGNFVDTASFGLISGNAATLTTPNGLRTNLFFTKHDKDGNLLWAKSVACTGVSQASDIVVDAANNIYISGYFSGVADLDPSSSTFSITGSGSYASFVAKYDANGNFIWGKMFSGSSLVYTLSLKLDNSNNVYLGGSYIGTADFDPGAATYNLTSVGDYDGFIVKLDYTGNLIWAKTIGGTNTDFLRSIALDANGNAYAIGYFMGTCDFDPSPTVTANLTAVTTANYNQDAFLVKLDANGDFVYVKQLGSNDYDEASCITVDAANNIYVGGYFAGTSDFDPSAAVYNLSSNGGAAGAEDIFIAKYRSNGNFVWAKAIGSAEADYVYSLKVQKNGVYFSGSIGATLDANPNSGVNNLNAPGLNTNGDAYVIKWDTLGNYVWAKAFGSSSFDFTKDVAVDTSNNVFITGTFSSTCDLSGVGMGAYTFSSAGQGDGFIIKLSPPTTTWYLDADNDGYGNGNQYIASSPGAGWSTTVPANGLTDCNDNNHLVWRSTSLFIDTDNDGYTNGTATVCYGAMIPNGYKAVSLGADCNDNLFNASAPVSTSSTSNTSICSTALPYSWNGVTFTGAGSQTAHLTNTAGCDSAATLNLTIKTNYTITAIAVANGSISNAGISSICSGNNQSYTITANSGYYISDVVVDGISVGNGATYTFTNVTGNHTISAAFTLTCQPTTSSLSITICSSQLPYVWNGLTFTGSGSQTKHLTNSCGSDSAATLNLTVNATSTSTTNITVCPNALPYSWNGLTFTGAASQTAHFSNAKGCDSAATLHLNITPQPIPANNNVCVGSTLQLTNANTGGSWSGSNDIATVSATGLVTGKNPGALTIKYKIPNSTTTNYVITVNALPNVPSIIYAPGVSNPQLGAPTGSFCINRTFGILGVPAGGVFTVGNSNIITINCSGIVNTVGLGSSYINYRYTNAAGCSNSRTMSGSVVNCASHRNSLAADEQIMPTDFVLYPNPAQSKVSLNINYLSAEGKIIVTNIYGTQVKLQALSMGTNIINLANLAKGMYFVTTISDEGKTTKKLVVE
jgi:hypothetical protein